MVFSLSSQKYFLVLGNRLFVFAHSPRERCMSWGSFLCSSLLMRPSMVWMAFCRLAQLRYNRARPAEASPFSRGDLEHLDEGLRGLAKGVPAAVSARRTRARSYHTGTAARWRRTSSWAFAASPDSFHSGPGRDGNPGRHRRGLPSVTGEGPFPFHSIPHARAIPLFRASLLGRLRVENCLVSWMASGKFSTDAGEVPASRSPGIDVAARGRGPRSSSSASVSRPSCSRREERFSTACGGCPQGFACARLRHPARPARPRVVRAPGIRRSARSTSQKYFRGVLVAAPCTVTPEIVERVARPAPHTTCIPPVPLSLPIFA